MVSSFSFFTRQCPYVSATFVLQEQNNGVWFTKRWTEILTATAQGLIQRLLNCVDEKMYIFNNQSWLNQAFVLFNVFGLFINTCNPEHGWRALYQQGLLFKYKLLKSIIFRGHNIIILAHLSMRLRESDGQHVWQ